MYLVEVGVAELDGGALVAVEVDERGRVRRALPLQVEGVLGRRVDERDERVDSFERVVAEEPALGDDVVAAARGRGEELDEVVALAVDALVRVRAVVGDEDEDGVGRERRALRGSPDAPDERVQLLERGELRGGVAVVVRGVVEVGRVEVEVAHARVGEPLDQLALGLRVEDVAAAEAELPLVEQLAGRALEPVLEAALERRPPRAALVELEADVALVVPEGVVEERDADLVEQLGAGHVHAHAADVGDPEGDEVEVVVGVERVAVELDVALNLQVLPRVEQRPGGPREAHPAHVEVRQPRAAFVEDVLEPRQHALAGARVALADEALDRVVRQAVDLDDDQPLRARGRSVRAGGQEQDGEKSREPDAADGSSAGRR